MAIVKSKSGRVSRFHGDDSPETISADESDAEEEFSDCSYLGTESGPSDADSGMESDEFDLSELGEVNTEFCQVGNQSFSVPFELFDLPDLSSVLTLETWNECLTEEERFGLSAFLPDMDQETLARTLTELFAGKKFHFGTPTHDLFSKLKGGMLDPRVVLYRRGLSYFRKREHYHSLSKYQNSMVGRICKIQDAWRNCSGYGIEERLRLLNLRSQRSLVYARNGNVGSETDSEKEEGLLDKRLKISSEPVRFVKDNLKEILKVAPSKASVDMEHMRVECQYPLSGKHGFEKKEKASKGFPGFPRRSQVDRFDSGGSQKAWNQMRNGDGEVEEEEEEDAFKEHFQELNARATLLKSGNKELLKQNSRVMEHQFGDIKIKGSVGLPQYSNKNRVADQGVTIAAYNPHSLETMSNAKYPAKDWMCPVKNRVQHQVKDVISSDRQVKAQESTIKSKKWKPEDSDSYIKTVQGKFKHKSSYNDGIAKGYSLGATMFSQSDETESDSSELEEDGELNPFPNKFGYPTSATKRTVYDSKKSGKITKVDISHEMHKSKTADPNYVEDIILVKKTQSSHPIGKLQKPWQKSYMADKKRKGAVAPDYSSEPNYMRNYGSGILNEDAEYLGASSPCPDGHMLMITDAITTGAGHYGRPNMPLLGCYSVTKKRKGNADIENEDDAEESFCQQSCSMMLMDEPNSIKKGKKKAGAVTVPSVVTPDKMIPEAETSEELKPKSQKKPFTLITPSKHTGFSFSITHFLSAIRKAMTTPNMEDTADIGNLLDKGDGKLLKPKSKENEALQTINNTDPPSSHEHIDVNAAESAEQNNLPSLTVQEIVNRVRSNPGDPCILETQEPLEDLVRGVLRIFSSRTAPLGAKAWKALVSYAKPNKSWSWVGPVSSISADKDAVEEETSHEAWGLPHRNLLKLVDSFANWLKSSQETLKLIGSFPLPPAAMYLQLDEKDRFRDLRAQKSLNTINPNPEEVREYFRKEEKLRYLIPDRAFSYTAADGKKSIVAPLRRGGGKPTSKARDHFMLKTDRPPHVTILCLVRDAAARLPGSIGTRADVCTLIRDSQYIVEEVSDEKVNQVVSGALDRLHYERDPCVRFDSDRKLWVYRHRDREEEDFEDDGTSSTKKLKRPRKDAVDQPETRAGNDASCPAIEDTVPDGSGGYDLNPDLNAVTSSVQVVTESIHVHNDLRPNMENIQPYIDPSSGGGGQGDLMMGEGDATSWQPLELNPLGENLILCQQNSANEDFEEAFSRERTVRLLSAGLL